MSIPSLLERLSKLIREVEGVDHHIPEDSALLGLAHDLAPRVSRLLRRGVDLLDAIADDKELKDAAASDSDSVSLTLEDIGVMISAEIAAQEIADLAYFAHLEIHQCLEELLEAIEQRNVGALASSCEKGLWRLRRALVSTESAICEFAGREAPRRLLSDLEISLQVRQLYAFLRREIRRASMDAEDLEDRLRGLVHRLVALRELKVYSLLRIDDRVQLRRLLKRILDWLHGSDRDPTEGRYIWQDLVGFTELLSHISLREEVQDHDRRLVGRAWTVLFPPMGERPLEVGEALLTELVSLLGADAELDELILARQNGPVATWREPLSRLGERLGMPLR